MQTAATFAGERGFIQTRLHESIDPSARYRCSTDEIVLQARFGLPMTAAIAASSGNDASGCSHPCATAKPTRGSRCLFVAYRADQQNFYAGDSHGFITSTFKSEKCRTFLVANFARRATTIPAIWVSRISIDNPSRCRLAASRAAASAAQTDFHRSRIFGPAGTCRR